MIETVGIIAFWSCVLLGLGAIVGEFIKANATVVAEPTPEQRDDYRYPLPAVEPPLTEYRLRVPPYMLERDPELTEQLPLDLTEPIELSGMLGSTYVSNGDKTSSPLPPLPRSL